MTYKSTPSRSVTEVQKWYRYASGYTNYDYYSYDTGSNTIRYDDGHRLSNGHWPWKACTHDQDNYLQPYVGSYSLTYGYNPKDPRYETYAGRYVVSPTLFPLPSGDWDPSTARQLMNQIDLNAGESVLLYSGVLQAVPLVGSVLKLSSILNRAAKSLSKSFRKRPFTTVVKSLISADFIDRFVIRPMIDDASRFAGAVDYVLRVISTAHERNASRFALQSSSKVTVSHEEGDGRAYLYGECPSCDYHWIKESNVTSKAFVLLETRYDIGALDPIKLWAKRVGLTRPLDSAWDLVPFSFVVDYFTRAGDFISRLSDEMSAVEGLQGKITRIYDMWGSFMSQTYFKADATFIGPDIARDWSDPYYWVQSSTRELGSASKRTSRYRRFQIGDPWNYLLSLEQMKDYLSVNLDLSQTRKRTLAELVIQAKL